jgi:O-succinylbenzoic acid--CoA ligase
MNPPAEPQLAALRLPPGRAWEAAAQRIWASGDAVLPLSPAEPAAATDAILRATRPSLLIDDTGTRDLAGGIRVAPGTAAVLATSGSTGAPKAAVLSWRALRASAAACLYRLDVRSDDRWLCCLPLHHVAGLQVLVRSDLMGVAPVVHDAFSVDAVAAEREVTLVSLVPTMLRRLLDAGADLRHLRRILLGGASPGAALLADARRAGLDVMTTYGMTETAGGCVYDGRALDGVDVRLEEDGHISLRGAVLFDGYRLQDDLTAAVLSDGWFRTEDLGRWSGDGRLEVLGRSDDVIITGGEKVAAGWLAALLESHPAVAEAAVTGRPDPDWGQRVVAFVVATATPPTLADLRDFVRSQAPAHTAPAELVVVDDLPRLASGKVDRRALPGLH